MSSLLNLFRLIGSPFSTETLALPNGFVPLSAGQMRRTKGGFDTEGDPPESDPDPDPDPLAGDPPYEEVEAGDL